MFEDPTQDDPSSTQEETSTNEHSVESPSPSVPSEMDTLKSQFNSLEDRYKHAERKISSQGEELRQYKEAAQKTTSTPETGGDFWSDPEARIDSRLQDMERRMEQRRQAETMLRDFAEEKGIPVRDLQRLNDSLQASSNDPYEYMDMLARLHQSENTTEAIQNATQQARDTVQQNARAVTSEGGSSGESPAAPTLEEMIDDPNVPMTEIEDRMRRTLGENTRD